MGKLVASRRAVLAGFAGAALNAGSLLRGAITGARSLVCIRIAGDTGLSVFAPRSLAGRSLSVTAPRSGRQVALHPALAEVRALFERSSLALVDETAHGAPGRAYLPDGFTGPAWMLQAAGATVTNPRHAFGFRSGLLMLAPDETEAGPFLDNPRFLAQAGRGTFAFPDSAIGRQLRQVAGLIASGGGQRHFVASMGATLTVGNPEEQIAERLRQLSAALAAFEQAAHAIGAASAVTTFTEPDLSGASGRRLRLVMGGAVIGGELYSLKRAEVDGALADWPGQSGPLALAAAPGARFLS